jgi:hypothetical protein
MSTPPNVIVIVEITIVIQVENYPITSVYYNSNLHIMSSSTTSQDDHKKLPLHSFSTHKNHVEKYLTIETK